MPDELEELREDAKGVGGAGADGQHAPKMWSASPTLVRERGRERELYWELSTTGGLGRS